MADSGWSDQEKKELIRLQREGRTVEQIADELGRSPRSVEKRIAKMHKERAEGLPSGVFLIGLALMFMGVLSWWPGIMFVLAATALASGFAEENMGASLQGALWLGGIGLLFTVGFRLELLFIVLGISSILGFFIRPKIGQPRRGESTDEEDAYYRKRKNDQLAEQDDYPAKAKRGAMRLGPDGELIGIDEAESLDDEAARRRRAARE